MRVLVRCAPRAAWGLGPAGSVGFCEMRGAVFGLGAPYHGDRCVSASRYVMPMRGFVRDAGLLALAKKRISPADRGDSAKTPRAPPPKEGKES